MEEPSENKFSYPNSDQEIPGVSGADRVIESDTQEKKPVVHILDALSSIRKEEGERSMRTYQEDITDAIKNDNVSMIKMSLAEKKRQEKQGTFDEVVAEKVNTTRYIAIGIFAVFIIMIGLGALYYFNLSSSASVELQNSAADQQLVYTETTATIDTNYRSSDDISRLIQKERDGTIDLGSMKEIILTTGEGSTTSRVSTAQFFSLLNTRVPDDLVRALDPVFSLGAYSYTPHDLFALFKVNTYDTAFAGMLAWEPYMESDIGGIFITRQAVEFPTAQSTPSTGSTSVPVSNGLPFSRGAFVDRVVDNKDVRALLNQDGSIALLYSFLDKNTLVISSSDKALKEISFRLTAGRIAR